MIEQLLTVWESAVRATHHLLSADEIAAIKQYVPQALTAVPNLIVIENEVQMPVGFIEISDEAGLALMANKLRKISKYPNKLHR